MHYTAPSFGLSPAVTYSGGPDGASSVADVPGVSKPMILVALLLELAWAVSPTAD
jgi:hypothetical protein